MIMFLLQQGGKNARFTGTGHRKPPKSNSLAFNKLFWKSQHTISCKSTRAHFHILLNLQLNLRIGIGQGHSNTLRRFKLHQLILALAIC